MKALSIVFTFLFLLTSCATKKNEEQDIEREAAQSTVSNPKALGGTIHDLIQASKTLSELQKQELGKIIEGNKKLAEDLSQQSYKFRAVLIQELLSGKINEKRIAILKNDIKKIEALRLQNTFDTVEKISDIVAEHSDRHKYSNHLLNIEPISFR